MTTDGHVDGSAHAEGLCSEACAETDRPVRYLLGEVHLRVVPWFVAFIGDEVEHSFCFLVFD